MNKILNRKFIIIGKTGCVYTKTCLNDNDEYFNKLELADIIVIQFVDTKDIAYLKFMPNDEMSGSMYCRCSVLDIVYNEDSQIIDYVCLDKNEYIFDNCDTFVSDTFSFSKNGEDEFYPSGNIEVNLSKFSYIYMTHSEMYERYGDIDENELNLNLYRDYI